MRTAIVGTKFRGAGAIAALEKLKVGDAVSLRREPQNEVDPNAVAVWFEDQHIGYVPRAHNAMLARLLDEDPATLKAEITSEGIVHKGEVKFTAKILISDAEELKF